MKTLGIIPPQLSKLMGKSLDTVSTTYMKKPTECLEVSKELPNLI